MQNLEVGAVKVGFIFKSGHVKKSRNLLNNRLLAALCLKRSHETPTDNSLKLVDIFPFPIVSNKRK